MKDSHKEIIVFFICIIYIITYCYMDLKNIVFNHILDVAICTLITVVGFVLNSLIANIKRIKMFFYTKIIFRNRQIRLSIAYLYRIKIDGKYLLVHNRHDNKLQPVGGVYKTLPGAEKSLIEKYQVKPDKMFETENGIAKYDLRINVPGKYVTDVFDWFTSKQDRELSPWREFCEELIMTIVLSWEQFRSIDYNYKGHIQTPLIKLINGTRGYFYFEVYDLVPNTEQETILRNILNKGDTETISWVKEDIIQNGGLDSKTKEYACQINPHTKWSLNMKWSQN